MSTIGIQVRGIEGVRKMLKAYTHPTLSRRMQTATKAGGSVFKDPLKAEARKVSKRMARGVSVRRARRERPATIVSIRPKMAFFRHFVIGGTRAHAAKRAPVMVFRTKDGGVVRTRHVRGVQPNPMIARVASQNEGQAYAAIDRDLDRTEPK
jgi:hypothetical protein